MITKKPIQAYYKQGVKIIMKIDLSDYVSIRVFSQLCNNELLNSIAFFFKNFNLAKCNYEIYDKDSLAII